MHYNEHEQRRDLARRILGIPTVAESLRIEARKRMSPEERQQQLWLSAARLGIQRPKELTRSEEEKQRNLSTVRLPYRDD